MSCTVSARLLIMTAFDNFQMRVMLTASKQHETRCLKCSMLCWHWPVASLTLEAANQGVSHGKSVLQQCGLTSQQTFQPSTLDTIPSVQPAAQGTLHKSSFINACPANK